MGLGLHARHYWQRRWLFRVPQAVILKVLFLDSLGTHSNIFQILKRFHFHFHLGLHLLADALLGKGQLAKMIFPFPCRGPSWISPLALGARSMIWMVMRMVIHDDRYEYHNYGILWDNIHDSWFRIFGIMGYITGKDTVNMVIHGDSTPTLIRWPSLAHLNIGIDHWPGLWVWGSGPNHRCCFFSFLNSGKRRYTPSLGLASMWFLSSKIRTSSSQARLLCFVVRSAREFRRVVLPERGCNITYTIYIYIYLYLHPRIYIYIYMNESALIYLWFCTALETGHNLSRWTQFFWRLTQLNHTWKFSETN